MQPSDLERYLERVVARLDELGAQFEEQPVISVDYDEVLGSLSCWLRFPGAHRLRVALIVTGPADFPEWLDYRVHLMDSDEQCVLRYDNSRHHPRTSYFPHHKHVGPEETVVDHPRPTIAQIIDEVRAIVYPS